MNPSLLTYSGGALTGNSQLAKAAKPDSPNIVVDMSTHSFSYPRVAPGISNQSHRISTYLRDSRSEHPFQQ